MINCKIHLELNWNNNYVNNKETTFQMTSTKLYVPIVTLSTKDNVNVTNQLNEGFKRSVYWNEYKSKIETQEANDQIFTRFPFDASFQGLNRLLCFAFDNTNDGDKERLKETVIESISFQE